MDQPINVLAVTPADPSKPMKRPVWGAVKPDGSGSFVATINTTPRKAPPQVRQPQRVDPNTARNGVPRQVGPGERQLDGTRTPTFSPPVKKGGLAAREAAPARSSGGSGLESAMASLADQLHPPRQRRS